MFSQLGFYVILNHQLGVLSSSCDTSYAYSTDDLLTAFSSETLGCFRRLNALANSPIRIKSATLLALFDRPYSLYIAFFRISIIVFMDSCRYVRHLCDEQRSLLKMPRSRHFPRTLSLIVTGLALGPSYDL